VTVKDERIDLAKSHVDQAALCLTRGTTTLNLSLAAEHLQKALDFLDANRPLHALGVEWRDPYADDKLRPGLHRPTEDAPDV
jgi:hypothetical protein